MKNMDRSIYNGNGGQCVTNTMRMFAQYYQPAEASRLSNQALNEEGNECMRNRSFFWIVNGVHSIVALHIGLSTPSHLKLFCILLFLKVFKIFASLDGFW